MVKMLLSFLVFCSVAHSQTMNTSRISIANRIKPLNQLWSLGFWGHYSAEPLTDIEWPALTHLVDFIYTNDVNGNVGTVFGKTFDPNLISIAHSNGVKVLIGLRPDSPLTIFSVISTNGNLPILTSNLMSILTVRGYDGIDLDYETPNPNVDVLSNILSSFRGSIGTNLLTFDWARNGLLATTNTVALVDRINAMTYDATCLTHTWFVNPLYGFPLTNYNYSEFAFWPWTYPAADSGYVHWYHYRLTSVMHIPPEKVNMGIAFYSYEHGGSTPPVQGPWLSKGTPPEVRVTSHNYNILSSNYVLRAVANYDNLARAAWFPISTGWIDFEDERSVREKCSYAINRGIGGVFAFAVEHDYDALKTPKHPLLHTIRKNLCRP